MMVWWDLEQESHDLVDVNNLNGLTSEARFEVGAPGKADSLHVVGKLVVELDLLGLPSQHLLLLLLSLARDDGGGRRLRIVTALSQVIAARNKR